MVLESEGTKGFQTESSLRVIDGRDSKQYDGWIGGPGPLAQTAAEMPGALRENEECTSGTKGVVASRAELY